jgi:hypothetical protein
MQKLIEILKELQSLPSSEQDGYNIASLPSIKHHKLGVSSHGQPMFFVKCNDSEKTRSLDCNLEFISVQFDRECILLLNNKKKEKGKYTVISLKSDSVDLQEYFLNVVFLVIRKFTDVPSLKEVKIEVEKLINLFSKLSKPPSKTIQGLWAEIFVIEQASDPDYIAQSWHKNAHDKFDFNDGADKIEVKSTSRSNRTHSFSIEQLNPNKGSDLIVVSLFTVETGMGMSIFDLLDFLEQKIKDKDLLLRINDIIAQTLGKEFEKAFDLFFDYQLALDSVQYYYGEDIPSIDISVIPEKVSNVRFDVDLADIVPIDNYNGKSPLHRSLF